MNLLLRNVIAGSYWPATALAADNSAPSSLWLGLLVPLIAVTAGLLALLWWLRRGQGLQGTRGPLKVVQAVAVGSRERVVVLDAQDRRLLLGVTAQRVELLAELRRDDTPDPATRLSE